MRSSFLFSFQFFGNIHGHASQTSRLREGHESRSEAVKDGVNLILLYHPKVWQENFEIDYKILVYSGTH
jgi:hypothetical protein